MTSIQLDDGTASGLAAIAASHGVSVADYLRSIVARENGATEAHLSPQDFDAELDPLVFDGPSLPADFSRADIYNDHD